MSYLINNQQKINEIIFDKRNKEYGAYVIRSAYGNTVFRSLAFMMLGFGTIMSLAFYFSHKPPVEKAVVLIDNDINDSIYTVNVDVEPKVEPVTQPHSDDPGNRAGLGTVINETLTAETSTTTDMPAGPTNTAATGEGPPGSTVTSVPEVTTVATATTDSGPATIYDTPPEFEGGLTALYSLLARNLRYPDMAREVGKEGTVYVKFVVDQNGKVGSLTLLNNAGYGFDEEALRVVGQLPNFKKAGTVGGKAVKVYYQLPIKFRIR